jgi:hypothetical protein
MSIDDLIEKLISAKNNPKNKFGGNTVVCFCEDNEPYTSIGKAELEHDEDGCVFLLQI